MDELANIGTGSEDPRAAASWSAAAPPTLNRSARLILIDNLNPVLGFARLLAESDALDAVSRRYARNICIAGERMLVELNNSRRGTRKASVGTAIRGEHGEL